ncbi:MAG: ElyC/SanA/YdcF family protein [Candidatus Omnitrophota bacterium]
MTIRNQNIICISSIDWDFNWQGHQEVMSEFARNGNRVLFIENTGVRVPHLKDIPRLKKRFMAWLGSVKGFKQEMENLYVYSPVVLPFPYSRIARWINSHLLLGGLKRWMKAMDFHEPIIWTFLPTGTALDIIANIDHRLLVYYCIADFYVLADNPRKIKKTENELLKKCDLIFAQGEFLKERCSRLNDNVHIFPFGVNTQVFDEKEDSSLDPPADIRKIKKPIIGYVGGIHRHVDLGLIRYLAKNHPEWSFVLIGPAQEELSKISGLNNIFSLGKKEFSELPSYIKYFDVATIPYEINEYTTTVFPTKLNEYHALGKPVVSIDLPEVIKYNKINNDLVRIAMTYQEFEAHINSALGDRDQGLIMQRRISAGEHDWERRIEDMSGLMVKAMKERFNKSSDWQRRFLKFYRVARRKAMRIVAGVLLVYFIVFYTPLAWVAAGPLKISEPPESSDCIVVFAGGVGESGKAGQGYEERVQRAVELYKKGYARHIIFSSGYMYVYEEPLLMKALAVSLGVPAEAILIEDKAKNTYENVLFSERILRQNGWQKIILVTSPYHMRRASLVFEKNARDLRVIRVPPRKSIFYAGNDTNVSGIKWWRDVNLEQIKGILHEYLSIIYYKWKGYI